MTCVPRLLWITPYEADLDELCAGLPDLEGIDAAVLYRRGGHDRHRLQEAKVLRDRCSDTGVSFFVSRRLDLARLALADGVHLPSAMPPVDEPEMCIGRSAHSESELSLAFAEGCDYCTLSPVFDSPGKGPALGVERFGKLARKAKLPILALGGIGPANLSSLLTAGAFGVAAIRSLLDPVERREMVELLKGRETFRES